MNQEQSKPENLIDTTDCLEAVGVFKGWKNAFFLVTLLCLFLLQVSFWLVDTGVVKTAADLEKEVVVKAPEEKPPVIITKEIPADANSTTALIEDNIETAAAEVSEKVGSPPEDEIMIKEPFWTDLRDHFKFADLAWTIRVLNFILIPVAVLYCLTMLFALKVSMLGRLGGINHIARAFFLSLIMLVFLLPWQLVFENIFTGFIYTPENLLSAFTTDKPDIISTSIYYLRFTGLWLLVLLFLIFTQIRSAKWANAMLRRLEVI
ncbi:MAG: hypothetical protein ACYTBP_12460 [Planctomycetota bacterium]